MILPKDVPCTWHTGQLLFTIHVNTLSFYAGKGFVSLFCVFVNVFLFAH